MLRDSWRLAIFLVWRTIQPSSMRAAHDFWESIMMSWSPEPFKEDRMRRFSIGVLSAAENRPKKKSPFGMPFFPNVAGVMKAAPTCKRPRSNQVCPIATISKPGWICMTPKKAERRENDFVPVSMSIFCDARFGVYGWDTHDDWTDWQGRVLGR